MGLGAPDRRVARWAGRIASHPNESRFRSPSHACKGADIRQKCFGAPHAVATIAAERERIGRELHDGVSQLLSSSLLRLNVLKDSSLPEVAVDSLDTVCGIVKEALDETRSLTFELSCPMLDELGLAAALEELCSSMTHEYSIHFE